MSIMRDLVPLPTQFLKEKDGGSYFLFEELTSLLSITSLFFVL